MVQETLQINIKADNKSGIIGVQETIQSLNKLDVSAKKAGAALGTADNAVKKSSATYQNLGRVIQDLPFGFQGIQNNLTQLIPSVGALGLAFSAIVSAITFAQVGFGAWTKGLKSGKKEADDYKKALDVIVESQAREIVELNRLTSIASNNKMSMDQRKNAVKELREEYAPYLKNLTDEQILAGNLQGAYEKITQALRAKIALQAAEEKLIPIIKEQLTLQQENFELQKQVEKGKSVAKQTTDWNKLGKAAQMAYFEATIGGEKAEAKIKDNEKAIERLDMLIKSSLDSMKDLFKESKQDTFKDVIEDSTEWENLLKRINNQLKDTKALSKGIIISGDVRLAENKEPEKIFGNPFTGTIKKDKVGFTADELGFDEGAKKAEAYKQELEGIYNLSNQLGQSFSQAILAGQNLGDVLGQVFKDLAAQILSAVLKALAFKAILAVINPTSAAASIGFGDLFSSFLGFSPKPFADGGVVNKPTLGVFGEAGSEAIMPLNKLNSMLMTASQLGGNSMADMTLNSKISGTDLLLWIQRAGYSTNLKR